MALRAIIATSGGGGGGAVTSVNGKTGSVILTNIDVGAAATSHTHTTSQISGLATVASTGSYSDLLGKPNLGTSSSLDVAATGNATATQVVKGDDSRLSDARTPLAHAHIISNVTGLQAALDAKASLSGADFTGVVTLQPPTQNTHAATKLYVDQQVATGGVTAGDGLQKSGIVLSVLGVNNQISVSSSGVGISATYAGQSSITTLGTIATGTWQGTAIADAYIASSATWNSKLGSNSAIDGGAY